jgi:hypothetical protein
MLAMGFGSVLVAWSLSWTQALALPAPDRQTEVRSREQTGAPSTPQPPMRL